MTKFIGTACILFWCVIPISASGQVAISEIMYDLSGTDTGHEWIELQNTSAQAIDLSSWKLFEANVNHSLAESQGGTSVPAGGFVIVADDPTKFKADWPSFAGAILNSSFSLNNDSEMLAIKNGDVVVDQISYTSSMGATGDGKSLVRSGSTFVSGTPSPGTANSADSSTSSANSSASTQSSSNTASTQSTSNTSSTQTSGTTGTGTTYSTTLQISADAGAGSTGVVGASVFFSGKAFGLKKEPLTHARMIWNFGDGATAEGVSVLHTYVLPGTYTVFLDVASGEYSATDKIMVTIVPATITISNVISGQSGYITISNGSAIELDLSRWYLRGGSSVFLLPAHTTVSARGVLTIPNAVSGLYVTDSSAELLYPNGEVEHRFTQPMMPLSQTSPIVLATESSPSPKKIDTQKVISTKNLHANKSQVALVASAEKMVSTDNRSEVLSVTRKSDSVSMWILGLSAFISMVMGGFWFAHRKSVAEAGAKDIVDQEDEDEFKIVE